MGRPAQVLGSLDETDQANGFGGVLSVARGCPRRLLQEPTAFVVPERLDVHSRFPRYLADLQALAFHPQPPCNYGVYT